MSSLPSTSASTSRLPHTRCNTRSNAGCVFVGEHSVESIGDYTAGPSHVMPTGGSARLRLAARRAGLPEGDERRAPRPEDRRRDRPPGRRHRARRGSDRPRPRRRKPPSPGAMAMSPKRDARHLVRPHLAAMAGYKPMDAIDVVAQNLHVPVESIVKLDGNENPYGPSPKVAEALGAYGFYHLYPDPEQRRVREAVAEYVGADASQIVIGNRLGRFAEHLRHAVPLAGRHHGERAAHVRRLLVPRPRLRR